MLEAVDMHSRKIPPGHRRWALIAGCGAGGWVNDEGPNSSVVAVALRQIQCSSSVSWIIVLSSVCYSK